MAFQFRFTDDDITAFCDALPQLTALRTLQFLYCFSQDHVEQVADAICELPNILSKLVLGFDENLVKQAGSSKSDGLETEAGTAEVPECLERVQAKLRRHVRGAELKVFG